MHRLREVTKQVNMNKCKECNTFFAYWELQDGLCLECRSKVEEDETKVLDIIEDNENG